MPPKGLDGCLDLGGAPSGNFVVEHCHLTREFGDFSLEKHGEFLELW